MYRDRKSSFSDINEYLAVDIDTVAELYRQTPFVLVCGCVLRGKVANVFPRTRLVGHWLAEIQGENQTRLLKPNESVVQLIPVLLSALGQQVNSTQQRDIVLTG